MGLVFYGLHGEEASLAVLLTKLLTAFPDERLELAKSIRQRKKKRYLDFVASAGREVC